VAERGKNVHENIWHLKTKEAASGPTAHTGTVGIDAGGELVFAALYKFVRLDNIKELRQRLLWVCQKHCCCGTILLAAEGVNGTICGSRSGIDSVLGWLRQDSRLKGIAHKESYLVLKPGDEAPFAKMKVRLKQEIVTIGSQDKIAADPLAQVGTCVNEAILAISSFVCLLSCYMRCC
jgi:predicted sulfurtransferase